MKADAVEWNSATWHHQVVATWQGTDLAEAQAWLDKIAQADSESDHFYVLQLEVETN